MNRVLASMRDRDIWIHGQDVGEEIERLLHAFRKTFRNLIDSDVPMCKGR